MKTFYADRPKRWLPAALLAAVTLFALGLLQTSHPAFAQEEQRPEYYDVIAGPHAVRVYPLNRNLGMGFLQYAVVVHDAATNEAVPNAKVVITVKNVKENFEGWARALNSPSEPEKFDVRVLLDSTGLWEVGVDVESPLGRGGAPVESVTIPTVRRYTSGSLVFFSIFGILLLGVAYIWWKVRRDRRRKAAETQVP